jgi:photosystem II stability/assembly factor-like uncharacterized protein
VAYVAAQGNLWASGPERGVYKTTDGGRTWRRVLFVDEHTGATDLVMDPSDPNTLYAATYQRQRKAWGFNGGGPGSGIHKTTDGGATWTRLEAGLPGGEMGRIGLAISASDPRVLNAIIEAAPAERGVYRSEDGGQTWTRVNEQNSRPMYYSHILIDPLESRRVYTLATNSLRSEDAGRTWTEFARSPTYDVGVHRDHHALWIDPADTRHLYLGTDGGLLESWDRGETFTKIDNLNIAQFYTVSVDMRDPYQVYGGLQDNHSWMGPSATRHWQGILRDDWKQIGFSDGVYNVPDPTDPRVVYSGSTGGNLSRVDPGTGDILNIEPYPPAGEDDYRFDWITPFAISRHDPRVLYFGGNRLFISRDRGLGWERTEDLSRRIDRDTLPIMGVSGDEIRLSRNDGASSFGEMTALAESPLSPQVLWAGMDDGNLQVSRDGGRSWTEVSRNLVGVPDGTYVSRIEASVTGEGAAYATFDGHRSGDFAPYLARTRDFGATWESLSAGLPSGSVNVIREHPENPGLLFLGTEHGLFVSGDAGATWTVLDAGLPTTLVDDMVIHPRDDDLVVGTHGLGIWILDDLTPLVEWSAAVASAPAHLFGPRPATVFNFWKDESYRGNHEFLGENPPFGALLSYHLAGAAATARVSVSDAVGTVIRTLDVPGGPGLHRIAWDLRHDPPPSEPDDEEEARPPAPGVVPHSLEARGPFVSPGRYRITLEAGDARSTANLIVRPDPLLPEITQQDYQARERWLVELLGLQRRAFEAAGRAEALGTSARETLAAQGGERAPSEVRERAERVEALAETLDGLRGDLYGLAGELNGNAVRPGSLHPPTPTQRTRREALERALSEALTELTREEAGAR